jgi:Ca2+-transporting ATPase
VVVATGMTTELNMIAGIVVTRNERTPLQRNLARLSAQLGLAVLGVAVVVLVIGLLRAVVYIPFLSSTFRTVPLGPEWAFIVPLALSGLMANEGIKYLHTRMRVEEDRCEVRTNGG